MTSSTRTLSSHDYTVGWICAIDIEYIAACELLDEEYCSPPGQLLHDLNAYTFGRIGDHNVVIARLPKGRYGIVSAATVAKDLFRSFGSIRIRLMVGIGGGAPSAKHDIRLGDVVVSAPTGKTGGVIHYEFGKTIQDRKFKFTGSLNSPPSDLLTVLNKVSIIHRRKGHRISESIAGMTERNWRIREDYKYPGATNDRLYTADHVHVNRGQPCETGCGKSAPPLIPRQQRGIGTDSPAIHYGFIASADQLMEDAAIRDALSKEHDILCFETEAAELMDNFPCVVIRGICDYADTHKNDQWQGYAAATAAAYAKELLQAMLGMVPAVPPANDESIVSKKKEAVQSTKDPQSGKSTKPQGMTYRVRGIPSDYSKGQSRKLLAAILNIDHDKAGLSIRSLANHPSQQMKVATITFKEPPPRLLTRDTEWSFDLPDIQSLDGNNDDDNDGDDNDSTASRVGRVTIDTHFVGLTPLTSFRKDADHKVE